MEDKKIKLSAISDELHTNQYYKKTKKKSVMLSFIGLNTYQTVRYQDHMGNQSSPYRSFVFALLETLLEKKINLDLVILVGSEKSNWSCLIDELYALAKNQHKAIEEDKTYFKEIKKSISENDSVRNFSDHDLKKIESAINALCDYIRLPIRFMLILQHTDLSTPQNQLNIFHTLSDCLDCPCDLYIDITGGLRTFPLVSYFSCLCLHNLRPDIDISEIYFGKYNPQSIQKLSKIKRKTANQISARLRSLSDETNEEKFMDVLGKVEKLISESGITSIRNDEDLCEILDTDDSGERGIICNISSLRSISASESGYSNYRCTGNFSSAKRMLLDKSKRAIFDEIGIAEQLLRIKDLQKFCENIEDQLYSLIDEQTIIVKELREELKDRIKGYKELIDSNNRINLKNVAKLAGWYFKHHDYMRCYLTISYLLEYDLQQRNKRRETDYRGNKWTLKTIETVVYNMSFEESKLFRKIRNLHAHCDDATDDQQILEFFSGQKSFENFTLELLKKVGYQPPKIHNDNDSNLNMLISFVGGGHYSTVEYSCAGKMLPPTRSSSFAVFNKLNQESKIHKFMLIGTCKSSWNLIASEFCHQPEIIDCPKAFDYITECKQKFSENKLFTAEQAEAFNEEIQKYSKEIGYQIYLVIIPEDMVTTEDFYEINRIMDQTLPHSCNLYVDVTHGWRHHPIIFFASINSYTKLRNINVKDVYYGELDDGFNDNRFSCQKRLATLSANMFYWAYLQDDYSFTEKSSQLLEILKDYPEKEICKGKISKLDSIVRLNHSSLSLSNYNQTKNLYHIEKIVRDDETVDPKAKEYLRRGNLYSQLNLHKSSIEELKKFYEYLENCDKKTFIGEFSEFLMEQLSFVKLKTVSDTFLANAKFFSNVKNHDYLAAVQNIYQCAVLNGDRLEQELYDRINAGSKDPDDLRTYKRMKAIEADPKCFNIKTNKISYLLGRYFGGIWSFIRDLRASVEHPDYHKNDPLAKGYNRIESKISRAIQKLENLIEGKPADSNEHNCHEDPIDSPQSDDNEMDQMVVDSQIVSNEEI